MQVDAHNEVLPSADLGYYHLWPSSCRLLSYLMQMRTLLVGKMDELEAPSII